ncbi:hypothetical protein IFR05_012494 [Cadophora sp. M221]|nr:hypothetical protein IFR05_012494 [Cadophora sp. M221]
MATEVLALDPIEIGILHQKGAFELPAQDVQDELISLFFTWVAPIVPIIQEADFLRRYRDPLNPPSLLLLQSIFVSVSRFPRKELGDSGGNPRTDSKTFFKKAKALYDAGYEQDQVTIVQSLVLMGWYWHGPQDVTENGLFYYSRLAIAVAQDCKMDRSAELTNLTQSQRRLYKRIWWTLFTRDRTVTVAYGRPVGIQLDHSNVDPITEDDFVEEGYTPNPLHIQFFLQYIELTKILHMSMLRPIKQRAAESLISHNQIQYAPPSILYAIMTVLATVKEQLTSPLPSIVLQSKRKVNICVRILDALSPTWPITRMLSEIADHVFSEKKFLDMFDAATKQFQDGEESHVEGSKKQYKRAVPTAKQSRPEMMLPKTRVTVKMLLSTAQAGNAVFRKQPLASKTISAEGSEGSQESARGSPAHPNSTRDMDTQDEVEDKSSDRRSKRPRQSYAYSTPAGDLASHHNSQELPLINDNWSSILPPIINDWDTAGLAPEQESPSQSSLDFNQWESFSELEAHLINVTRLAARTMFAAND